VFWFRYNRTSGFVLYNAALVMTWNIKFFVGDRFLPMIIFIFSVFDADDFLDVVLL
jgi:hypothetical protein